MLHSDKLPSFVFVGEDDSEQILDLTKMTHRIRAVADHLADSSAAGSTVGLMFPSGPDLVVNWLACLLAKLQPLVMQYPTKKQSREYWAESVQNTMELAGITSIVADKYSAGLGLAKIAKVVSQEVLDQLPDGVREPIVLTDFAIMQLSSGTTGHRKAIRFTSADLRRHITDYNKSLLLNEQDKIVSWLPLYHDMGYVACFVMPMMLGVPVVMIDPMTWIRQPDLLFDAIDRHQATICYMPNFGFEVMSHFTPRRLPTIRWWISCSEPVSAETSNRFLHSIEASEENFAPCYAMAENIFAVTIRPGLQVRRIEQSDVVSCGKPIAGVRLKILEGEIWVSSPTALERYIGGEDIRDRDGFYPTGDLGLIEDGELYVIGRKQDLLIQAGRKFMLSDIDLVVNRLYPEIRGRAAALQVYDDRLGTQKPLVLIEAMDFFQRQDGPKISEALRTFIGLDQIEVEFVPPRFLTKTSSGKINRKASAHDWRKHRDFVGQGRQTAHNPVAEIHASFPADCFDEPISKVLDSLSLTLLRIILSGTGVKPKGRKTLRSIEAELRKPILASMTDSSEIVRIVSLADLQTLNGLEQQHLESLSETLGCPVVLEHVCLPPSPIILSDFIFHDYFQPRLDQEAFSAVDRILAKLRSASLLLMDDVADMWVPPSQDYGVLSHGLERSPLADLLSVRWQRYALRHHQLPLTVVSGSDLPLEFRSRTQDLLSTYLKKPIFRIATSSSFGDFTRDWEYRPLIGPTGTLKRSGKLDWGDLLKNLATWIAALPDPPARYAGDRSSKIRIDDLGHFCSGIASQQHVDRILEKYNSFYLAGQRSSTPYIWKRLIEMGKPFRHIPSFSPRILEKVPEKYECLLICGAQGAHWIDNLPTAAIMRAGVRAGEHHVRVVHIDDPELTERPFWVQQRERPNSGEDWFYPFELNRKKTRRQVSRARTAAGSAATPASPTVPEGPV
jgi:acyl-CoA synthetase (AMP-forming)/AMP-acid ligase II